MGFLRRLGWYLLGLSLGIIILVFILKKKSEDNPISFCYLPNCRVLKDMRSKTMVFGENLDAKYKDTLLVQTFLMNGNIDFRKSNTEAKPCKKYLVEHPDESLAAHVQNCDSILVVEHIITIP
ncbi:MAG: DUF4258 domain-containing protein [Bacteroidota bacterium]